MICCPKTGPTEVRVFRLNFPGWEERKRIFEALAEFESDQISERTKAGQQAAKERGVLFGRAGFAQKYIESGRVEEFQKLWNQRKAERGTITSVLADLKIPRSTYIKYRDIFLSGPIDDIGSGESDEITTR